MLPPFQEVLDAHRADVYRFLVAVAGRQDADDCFQETFMSALRAYPRLTDASNLRGWLLTIAHRKALDAHRARGRRPIPVEEVAEQATEDPLPHDGELWEAVRALPAKQRAAVALRFAADLPYRQIGDLIDSSEEAARANVHEGLRRLRKGWSA